MPSKLASYALLRFTGEDARAFLHGQLSCDVEHLAPGRYTLGSYNTPKGRMLASFRLWPADGGYMMQIARDIAEPVRKRLAMFILRAKAKAEDVTDAHALLGLRAGDAGALAPAGVGEVRVTPDCMVLRVAPDRVLAIVPAGGGALAELASKAMGEDEWRRAEIRDGIPWVVAATQDQFVPQMANLEVLGGVSFTKGCYPGQEIVARTKYLGKLKERMYLAHAPGSPVAGEKLYSAEFGEQASGMIANAAPSPDGGSDVLAVMRISSAQAGDVRLGAPDGPKLELLPLPYEV